ncbi:Uncharacterised protein [Collinsella intestinalis]|nr:Uncharacterised protein [Collinsella intestinalis]
MRTLELEEFGIGHGRDPGIALNSGMLAIERATVINRIAGPIARDRGKRLRKVAAVGFLDILDLNLDGDDGAPAIEQRAGILDVIQRQTKLLGNDLELDRTMTMNTSKDLRGAGDLGWIHTANLSVPAEKNRGHAELRADALGNVVDVKTTGHAEEKLEHANAARPRGEKMSTLVHEHEDRQKQKAPKDGAENSK